MGDGLMRGTKPHLVVSNDAVSRTPNTPSCLSKDAKAEWRRIMPALTKRKILTTADLGSVENYCIATGRVREIERLIQQAGGDIDPRLFRMQDKAMQTARQLAAELGLTPVSRSRPAMREEGDDDDLSGLDL
jgi:P27 family predicted phage terminase small subunit